MTSCCIELLPTHLRSAHQTDRRGSLHAVALLETLKGQLAARGPVWNFQLNAPAYGPGADPDWVGLGGGPWLCPTPASELPCCCWAHSACDTACAVLPLTLALCRSDKLQRDVRPLRGSTVLGRLAVSGAAGCLPYSLLCSCSVSMHSHLAQKDTAAAGQAPG